MANLSKTFGKLTIPLLLLLAICFFALPARAKYGGGKGEPNDPYQIGDANHMQAIGADSNDWDKHFKLMADIDLSAYTGDSFNMIGYAYYDEDALKWVYYPFTGVFDGNGHTISNFSYTPTYGHYIGLFGYVAGGSAEVKDLGLIDTNIDAGTGNNVGPLLGFLGQAGSVSDCYVEGGSVSGHGSVGGLVGGNNGTITNCYSSCSVSGIDCVGGLAGSNGHGISEATITGCYSIGDVSGNNNVGGLVGVNSERITGCYCLGDVSGFETVGGLVGENVGTIANCYSAGSVTGLTGLGGLVASSGGLVFNSFWDTQTSGRATSAGGVGKTTAEMKDPSTYILWGSCTVWTIDAGVDYPHLEWENQPGEVMPRPAYGGGSGTESDPYLIYTAEQLNTIGLVFCDWDNHFLLCADIDLAGYTGTSYNIIGTDWDKPFVGVFDGNGHTISNFNYDASGLSWPDNSFIGIFGFVWDRDAQIKDLVLINPVIDCGTGVYAGPLVGRLNEGDVRRCYVEGGSVSGNECVGGLVGWCGTTGSWGPYRTISDCYSTASVTAGDRLAGGLVGRNSGTISNCYSGGSVLGDDFVGGLVGHSDGEIINCYSTGSVSGSDYVGGFIGSNRAHVRGVIANCYSTGSVVGVSNVGGLVGYNEGGEISNNSCFWDKQTSGQATSAGGTGKTTAEMKDPNTYIGWGCGLVWTLNAGVDYPRLWWENAPGEAIDTQLSDFVAGAGTESEPYLIYTAEQLNIIGLFVCELDKDFRLMADIDLAGFTGTSFNIIGNHLTRFTGTFDGNGQVISNFTYTSTNRNYIGIFGHLDGEDAEVKDLGLVNPDVQAGTGDYIGTLVSVISQGRIKNCYVTGGSVSGCKYVGGLAADNEDGSIENCHWQGVVSVNLGGYQYGQTGGLVGTNLGTVTNSSSSGDVSGGWDVGGLVGGNWSPGAVINRCHSTANVFWEGGTVGGLVGYNYYRGTITDCYARGSVTGDSQVGGLVGYNRADVMRCYSTGSVSGTGSFVGGLVGSTLPEGIIDVCFWDKDTSGKTTSAGGIGLPTAQMQDPDTFISFGGWDFVGESANGTEDIWRLCNDGAEYPQLNWQYPLGDFGCPDGVDWSDLVVLCEQWLQVGAYSADIAPPPAGDGIVNFLDFAALADNWLAGPPPGPASNPNPPDGATGVDIDADLSWTAGAGATSHDVYFGTSSPGTFQRNQTETTFEPGTMTIATTYYWRIDEVNAYGTTTGTLWSFTTELGPPPP